MNARCGATTRGGEPCRRRPVPGGSRCLLHGGLSTGPRTPEGRARSAEGPITHGIYASEVSEEARQAVAGAGLDLSGELVAARVQLARALAYWEEWSSQKEALPLTEVEDSPTGTTTKRRRPDLWSILDRCLGRVGHLVEQQARVQEVQALQGELDGLRELVAEMPRARNGRPRRHYNGRSLSGEGPDTHPEADALKGHVEAGRCGNLATP